MKSLTNRVLLVLLGLAFSCAVFSQPGGFGGGRGGGTSGSNTGVPRETSVEGTWVMEFELKFHSEDPRAVGERVTLRTDVTVTGTEVTGRFRRPADGNFTCTILEGSDRCDSGRLVVIWPGKPLQEAGSIEFVVDQIDGRRAQGEATFNTQSGAIRQYTVNMRKR